MSVSHRLQRNPNDTLVSNYTLRKLIIQEQTDNQRFQGGHPAVGTSFYSVSQRWLGKSDNNGHLVVSSMYVIFLSITKMTGKPYCQQLSFCIKENHVSIKLSPLKANRGLSTTYGRIPVSKKSWMSKLDWSRLKFSTLSSLNPSRQPKSQSNGNLTKASIRNHNGKWESGPGWAVRRSPQHNQAENWIQMARTRSYVSKNIDFCVQSETSSLYKRCSPGVSCICSM